MSAASGVAALSASAAAAIASQDSKIRDAFVANCRVIHSALRMMSIDGTVYDKSIVQQQSEQVISELDSLKKKDWPGLSKQLKGKLIAFYELISPGPVDGKYTQTEAWAKTAADCIKDLERECPELTQNSCSLM